MNRYALIVAGGSGSRMQSSMPKQFIQLAGKPILFRTLEKFASLQSIEIHLVLPKAHIKNWEELCLRYGFEVKHSITEGGETRFHSVKKGLEAITGDGLVAVHDGVRPLVSRELIERLFTEAEKKGNAVPAILVNESMRSVSGEKNFFTDRSMYRLIQTPQCFFSGTLKKAFDREYGITFTDEANVAEASGMNIHLVEGEVRNIKITTPDDLITAEAFVADEIAKS